MQIETISMRTPDLKTANDKTRKRIFNQLNCACIGIVKAVYADNQTVDVQPVVKGQRLHSDLSVSEFVPPLLLDVPLVFFQGGNYTITVPVAVGDEVLVVFTDSDYSAWWQSGGVQNPQRLRKHNLSNAIAIAGVNSVPNAISNWSNTGVTIRTRDNSQYISVEPETITLKSATINIEGNLNVNGDTAITGNTTITGSETVTGDATIGNISYLSHVHGTSEGNTTAPIG